MANVLIRHGVSAWDTAKPLADEAIGQDPRLPPRAFHAFCPAALPLSSKTLTYTAGVIRRHRRKIGSAWRKPNPGRQAPLALAYLRKGETFAQLAAGFGIGTALRYVTETVALLAARAPKLGQALAAAKDAGHAYVVIARTLIPIDWVAADRPFYSGKHRRQG